MTVTPDTWCTVDTVSGSLMVTLSPSDCFSAECYLDELEPMSGMTASVKQDQRGEQSREKKTSFLDKVKGC